MKQKGFTLIELLVALGVGTIILTAVVGSFFLIMRGVPDIREQAVALSDLDRAAHWLTRDIAMGLSSNLVDAAPPVAQVTISWVDYTREAELEESVSHSVIYTWTSETGKLQRNYDGLTTIVGEHLTNVGFSLDDRFVTASLTVTIDEDSGTTVTRSYKILMRGETDL